MGRAWFTSDLHLGHKNIIPYCKRPFADVEEMDRVLTERWNARVAECDTVYVLGDFMFHQSHGRVGEALGKLNGSKVLVAGNHDDKRTRKAKGWSAVYQEMELSMDGLPLLYLCHFPKEDWPGRNEGIVHLHGHWHGTGPGMHRRFDVGVDCWGFEPVSPERIRFLIQLEQLGEGISERERGIGR